MGENGEVRQRLKIIIMLERRMILLFKVFFIEVKGKGGDLGSGEGSTISKVKDCKYYISIQ